VTGKAGHPNSRRGASYRAANWDRTSLHAGESCAALVARHCTIRPPPAGTPPQIVRTSAPHADRSTNSSSRGRQQRSRLSRARQCVDHLNKSFAVAGSRRFDRSEIWNVSFRKNRKASFSLSGSAASGLLLFSWGGGKPVFE
jgi:hypothetical protein